MHTLILNFKIIVFKLSSIFFGRSQLCLDHWWDTTNTNPNCDCGSPEDAHHYFFTCPMYPRPATWADPSWSVAKQMAWIGKNLPRARAFLLSTKRFSFKDPMFRRIRARFQHLYRARGRRARQGRGAPLPPLPHAPPANPIPPG